MNNIHRKKVLMERGWQMLISQHQLLRVAKEKAIQIPDNIKCIYLASNRASTSRILSGLHSPDSLFQNWNIKKHKSKILPWSACSKE